MSPMRQTQRHQVLKNILHHNKTKEKHVIAGWALAMATTTVIGSQRLIPGTIARVIGLLHMLQGDIHCYQDIAGHEWILGDPRDGRHTKILQDLGDI
jgi:hypothetical protein